MTLANRMNYGRSVDRFMSANPKLIEHLDKSIILKQGCISTSFWEARRFAKAVMTAACKNQLITKSELYKGKKITYHAPFDKCDRVEDYKEAWGHFEKVFKNT